MRNPENPGRTIIRYIAASTGAFAITIGLFLFMQDLVIKFLERDPTRYFSITSFIPAPDRGRQLPDAPPAPTSSPGAPTLDYEEEAGVIIAAPIVEITPDAPVAGELNLAE